MAQTCEVSWCLDQAVTRRSRCRLHDEYPVLHSREKHDEYFARLRAAGVNGANRRQRKTSDAKLVPLIDGATPPETGVSLTKDRA